MAPRDLLVVALFALASAVGCLGSEASDATPRQVLGDGTQSFTDAVPLEDADDDDGLAKTQQQRLSDKVRAVLQHFKQDNPTGFPGADVPDPMTVPPMSQSFALASMSFSNVTVHGLSRFRFHEARVNLTTMKAELTALIDAVLITGNYTLSTWFSSSAGGFTVTLEGVRVSGLAGLEVGPGGRLRAEEIGMDVTFDRIQMDFKNLGLMMSLFQGMINKVGSFLFDNIKPFILSEINANMREEVDKQVAAVGVRFPSSMVPIDVVVADARHTVRTLGYDPYRLPDITRKAGPVEATVTHLFASGLSSFYRRGDVAVWMREHVLHAGMHLATKALRGTCRWAVHVPGAPALVAPLMRRAGDASFTVDYLEVRVVFNQSLDTRRHPYLESLDLTLGPMALVSRGDANKLNAISEFGVNVLPNLLRYQIVDALEAPIVERVQAVLDTVNVEELINERLEDLEQRLAAANATAPTTATTHTASTASTTTSTSTASTAS